jgi:perosamine synthetase
MLVEINASLLDAMKIIESNAKGICFILNKGLLVGLLTDGDVRRAIIEGTQLNESIALVMNRNFTSIRIDTPISQIQHLLSKYLYVPITNEAGMLLDYACEKRYHHIPLTQPVLDGNELEYVTDCINSGWISSQGKYVRLFEESFGDYIGNPNTLAVSNGTVALHLALVALGIGPGDEVIVPDLTFAAPVNAILYVGATPVLVDIDHSTMTLNMDAAELAVTPRTKAIIPVHLYGHPANMIKVMDLAYRHNLLVIEDCAEAIGSRYQGRHVGNFGHAAIYSFFGNKTITTGEGGMLLFKDTSILDYARTLRDHGMSNKTRYWHEHVGYNYRMTNIQAAIGLAQMERVEKFVNMKRFNAKQYYKRLESIPGIKQIGEVAGAINSYWFYTIILPDEFLGKRDEIIKLMLNNGVEIRPVFYPIHRMPPYMSFVKSQQIFPVADLISNLGISLPSGVLITEADIDKVSVILKQVLSNC